MHLYLRTADQFFKDDEHRYLFVAHAVPSNYSEVVFDKLQHGRMEVGNGENPLQCEVFIRRVAGDDRQVRVTLRFDKGDCGTPLSSDSVAGAKVSL